MSDALNDWNTPLPLLGEITELAHDLGRQGFDVHTVNIVLSGHTGNWDVEVHWTDEDLQDGMREFELGTYGSLEPV